MIQGVDAKPTVEEFSELCEKFGGNVTAIAKAIPSGPVARNTVYSWINTDEEFKAAFEDARESSLDIAEDRMMKLIEGIPVIADDGRLVAWQERPDSGLIKFKLATHGSKRGYGEKLALTDPDGEKLDLGFAALMKEAFRVNPSDSE